MESAQDGNVALNVPVYVICEAVFVLEGQGFTRQEISGALARFLAVPGVEASQAPQVLVALSWYRDKNVDFADALLYAESSDMGCKVLTFNKRHFQRLGSQWKEP
jgi:predicted nucleic-acid-binding protein